MASVERLREAAATGKCYEALLAFKSVLTRKANARKDRAACVKLIRNGVAALFDGAAASPSGSVQAVVAPAVDVASQLVDSVFGAFRTPYDVAAVADARAVALAMYPQLDSALVAGPDSAGSGSWELGFVELNTALRARAAAAFVDRVIRWTRERGTVRGTFPAEAVHEACALNWLRGVALTVASTAGGVSGDSSSSTPLAGSPTTAATASRDTEAAAKAVQHLVNVTALPPGTPQGVNVVEPLAVAVVNWCGPEHAARSLPWFAARVTLQLLAAGKPEAALRRAQDFDDLVRQVALRAVTPADQPATAESLAASPLLLFVQIVLAAAAAKDKALGDAALAHFEATLASGDERLPALAQHALSQHGASEKAASSGGGSGGLLHALLGGGMAA